MQRCRRGAISSGCSSPAAEARAANSRRAATPMHFQVRASGGIPSVHVLAPPGWLVLTGSLRPLPQVCFRGVRTECLRLGISENSHRETHGDDRDSPNSRSRRQIPDVAPVPLPPAFGSTAPHQPPKARPIQQSPFGDIPRQRPQGEIFCRCQIVDAPPSGNPARRVAKLSSKNVQVVPVRGLSQDVGSITPLGRYDDILTSRIIGSRFDQVRQLRRAARAAPRPSNRREQGGTDGPHSSIRQLDPLVARGAPAQPCRRRGAASAHQGAGAVDPPALHGRRDRGRRCGYSGECVAPASVGNRTGDCHG